MAADRKLYGWREGGKYYLSRIPPDTGKPRPRNEYATMQEALAEAGRRGLQIEWADGVVD